MDRFSHSHSTERVALSWIVAGLTLIALVGLSFSIEEPAPGMAGDRQEVPVYAIDEELAPLQSGALPPESPYAELIAPASYRPESVRTGVAP